MFLSEAIKKIESELADNEAEGSDDDDGNPDFFEIGSFK